MTQTPFPLMLSVLIVLWLLFSAGVYFSERNTDGASITSYGDALYWGIAAFSTAGIAGEPLTGATKAVGGVWIVLGSIVFFGTIVATVTTYFNRPMKRPIKQMVDTIEYNLEQIEDLSPEELEVLRHITDSLIEHIERIREKTGTSDAPSATAGSRREVSR